METEHKLRIGVFTGTFDPFTIGHQNITERALKLFDELYIAIAVSKRKNTEKEIEDGTYLIQAQDTTVKIQIKTSGLHYDR